MRRERWGSKLGFVWSAVGSAVGLGSIWRFPYVAGQNGGGAFVLLFCVFLIFLSLPILIAEIIIGRKSHSNPHKAFKNLGKGKFWAGAGFTTVMTGFLISSFYSVICGWTLGYLIKSIGGGLCNFQTLSSAKNYFADFISSPVWTLGTHLSVIIISVVVLFAGVQKGIEAINKVLIPLLVFILIALVVKGFTMPGFYEGVQFLFQPKWKDITFPVAVTALGQAFFGLSVGQGTMVTYGSYLSSEKNTFSICFPVAISVIFISLLSGIAIFSVVFSSGMEPAGGINLMFETLPIVFSQIMGGHILAFLFFSLIFFAGITSQISAMEPMISFFIDEAKLNRHHSVILTGFLVFLFGVPSALCFGVWSDLNVMGMNFFDAISFLCINILVPIGGLFAVLMVGWKWGVKHASEYLVFTHKNWIAKFIPNYLEFTIKYLCPVVITIILLDLLGVF